MGISKSHDKMYFISVHISYPSPYDVFRIAISHWESLSEGEKRQALYFFIPAGSCNYQEHFKKGGEKKMSL